ncbi:hypothetical protein TNCV_4485951 [Trichonephila clavipes]|nr:hypothetical protein TNCV_4485951 [Trichonephila clavipes]
MCTAPFIADKDILEFFQSSEHIIDADSDDENEMNFKISSFHVIRNEEHYKNCRATSHLDWLLEGKERWESFDRPQGIRPQNWSGTKQNRTATCMDLKAKANDSRTTST